VSCLTTTHARTKRSKEIPGVGRPGTVGADALMSTTRVDYNEFSDFLEDKCMRTVFPLDHINHRRRKVETGDLR